MPIVLDPSLSACHLKRWTIRSVIMSDVFDTAFRGRSDPQYDGLVDDLNLKAVYRWSSSSPTLRRSSPR